MRTWFDRAIELVFVGIAVGSVIAAGQTILEIARVIN